MTSNNPNQPARYLKLYQSSSYMIVNISALTLLFFVIWRFQAAIYNVIIKTFEISPNPGFNAGVLMTIIIIAIYALIALSNVILWRNTYYEVFPDHFVVRKKIISEKSVSVNTSDFITIDVSQGIIGKLFGYGDIVFNYRIPVEGGEQGMPNISNPFDHIKIINQILGRSEKSGKETSEAVAAALSQGEEVQTHNNPTIMNDDSKQDAEAYVASQNQQPISDDESNLTVGRIEMDSYNGNNDQETNR